MAGKINLFNLTGAEPEDKLKAILAKVDIDYQQHVPTGTSKESKASVEANILSSIQTSRKLILFKTLVEANFATDQDVIKDQNIEKNFEQIRIVSIITKRILNKIMEEAINNYLSDEQIKAIQIVMREWRQRYETEKDERIRDIYESQMHQIMADEAFQRHLHQQNHECMSRINEHDNKINNINDLIGNIKEKKSATVNDAATSVGDELATRTAEDSDLLVYKDVIPEENRDQFMKDFLKEYYKAEKEVNKYIALDKYDQAKVDVQLPSLINYHLARNNNKSVKELAKREPDFEKMFVEMGKKNSANLSLLTSEQIKAEANLLAAKFKPAVLEMIHGKNEKIELREQCVHLETEKQKEKVKMQTLYSKLELPLSAKITKTSAETEFDDFLSKIDITPKLPKAVNK